jgi:transposase InsO family protein
VARYPNHVWMADLTEIPGFLRIFSCVLGGILDVRSRMPLAARLYPKQPTAEDLMALLDAAIERHGPPRHFVSDLMPAPGLCRVVRLGVVNTLGSYGWPAWVRR